MTQQPYTVLADGEESFDAEGAAMPEVGDSTVVEANAPLTADPAEMETVDQ